MEMSGFVFLSKNLHHSRPNVYTVNMDSESSGGNLHKITSLLMAFALAGVVFSQAPAPTKVIATAAQTTSTTATTTSIQKMIWLGSAVPAAGSDKLYSLSLNDKKIKAEQVPPGWRLTALEEGRQELALQPSNEGFRLTGEGWDISLRNKNGQAYQMPLILSVLDGKTAIISAQLDRQLILKVSKSGSIQELKTLDQATQALGVSAQFIWLTTFTPGEGIESSPSGPSALFALGLDGATQEKEGSEHLITNVVAFDGERYAASLEGEEFFVNNGKKTWMQTGKPLVWIDESRLIFAKGTTIMLFDLHEGSKEEIASLPTVPSMGKLEE